MRTAAARDLQRLTAHAGADESPDRQAIPACVRGYAASARDFGGLRRVQLRRRDGDRRRLVAVLCQRCADR